MTLHSEEYQKPCIPACLDVEVRPHTPNTIIEVNKSTD